MGYFRPVKAAIAILTGDIVGSAKSAEKQIWLVRLKRAMKQLESLCILNKDNWEIYRGDSFQLSLEEPKQALRAVLVIRAALKALPLFEEMDMDVRISIGIGVRDFEGDRVSESDGPAYHYSGHGLDEIEKDERRLIIKSDWPDLDDEMRVNLSLAEVILSNWSAASAEVCWHLFREDITQKELAVKLGISQPAVNKRIARAHLEEILLLEQRFRNRVSILQAEEKAKD